MIFERPPKEWLDKRPAIPLATKLEVIKRWLKDRMAITLEIDHRPPLIDRPWDSEIGDTIPAANDPAYLEAITVQEHKVRTHGPGGEKRITTAGSDAGNRKKARRIKAQQARSAEKMQAKAEGKPVVKNAMYSWGKHKLRSRNDLRKRKVP